MSDVVPRCGSDSSVTSWRSSRPTTNDTTCGRPSGPLIEATRTSLVWNLVGQPLPGVRASSSLPSTTSASGNARHEPPRSTTIWPPRFSNGARRCTSVVGATTSSCQPLAINACWKSRAATPAPDRPASSTTVPPSLASAIRRNFGSSDTTRPNVPPSTRTREPSVSRSSKESSPPRTATYIESLRHRAGASIAPLLLGNPESFTGCTRVRRCSLLGAAPHRNDAERSPPLRNVSPTGSWNSPSGSVLRHIR